MPSKTYRTHRASAIEQSDIPCEVRNGGGAVEARDQKCTRGWRNENLACLPWRIWFWTLAYIFSVDIKLQNHLVNFALTFMNSTGVDGEVGAGATSSYMFAFCGASGNDASARFGGTLHYLNVFSPTDTICLFHFIY